MSLIARITEPFPSDSGEKRFTLRMNASLFDAISAIAKNHKRSVAKEIECAIECYALNIIDSETNATEQTSQDL